MSEVTEKKGNGGEGGSVDGPGIPDQGLRAFIEALPESVVTVSEQGVVLYANEATERVFGYSFRELAGRSLALILPQRLHSLCKERAHEEIKPLWLREERSLVLSGRRKDGAEVPLDVSCFGLRGPGSAFYTMLFRSVSERTTSESVLTAALSEGADQYEELSSLFRCVEAAKREWEKAMDCVSDMVILTDKEGLIKRCNRALCEFAGKGYAELLGRDWQTLLAEQGLPVKDLHGSELFHQPSGNWFAIELFPFTGIDQGSEISGLVVTIHNITELTRVTRELERKNREIYENSRRLRAALEELSLLIQRAAREKVFSIRFSNPKLKKCYEEMNCEEKECPCYGREPMRCWQVAGTHCGGSVQGVFARKFGTCSLCPVFKDTSFPPIYQLGEQFNNMMHILELKNNELSSAYEALKVTQAKIVQQEKMASIGLLAAGVAHEINNPIGFVASNIATLAKYVDRLVGFIQAESEALKGLSDAAVLDALEERKRSLKLDYIIGDIMKLIEESAEGTERVRAIVQNLKVFSRVDQAEYKYADINECLDSTINIAWNEIKYKAELKKEYSDLSPTKCYPQQLNQVFLNLLINAVHAIEKQGLITVRTWEEKGSIFVSLSDTGIGIPEENLPKIFDPFFTTKEVGKGTGLGLSIVYDIIKHHNGDIMVQSLPGKGTTFTVRIPVVTEN